MKQVHLVAAKKGEVDPTPTITAKVSSGASISVHASESIDGKASSGGGISFEGNPEKITRKTSSGGSISN